MQTRRPQITSFEFPRDTLITAAMLSLLIYVTFSAPSSSSSLNNIGAWIRSAVGGPTMIKYIWGFAGTIHALETVYIFRMCTRHSVGVYVGVSYSNVTSVLGSYMTIWQMAGSIRDIHISVWVPYHYEVAEVDPEGQNRFNRQSSLNGFLLHYYTAQQHVLICEQGT